MANPEYQLFSESLPSTGTGEFTFLHSDFPDLDLGSTHDETTQHNPPGLGREGINQHNKQPNDRAQSQITSLLDIEQPPEQTGNLTVRELMNAHGDSVRLSRRLSRFEQRVDELYLLINRLTMRVQQLEGLSARVEQAIKKVDDARATVVRDSTQLDRMINRVEFVHQRFRGLLLRVARRSDQ